MYYLREGIFKCQTKRRSQRTNRLMITERTVWAFSIQTDSLVICLTNCVKRDAVQYNKAHEVPVSKVHHSHVELSGVGYPDQQGQRTCLTNDKSLDNHRLDLLAKLLKVYVKSLCDVGNCQHICAWFLSYLLHWDWYAMHTPFMMRPVSETSLRTCHASPHLSIHK